MMMPKDCTPRCLQFLADLATLCDRYRVYVTPSGFDTLQIWDRLADDPGGFDWDVIEDCTDVEQEPSL